MSKVAEYIYQFAIYYGTWLVPVAPMIEYAKAQGGEVSDWVAGIVLELVGILTSYTLLKTLGSKSRWLKGFAVFAVVAYLATGILTVGLRVDWATASIFVLSAIAYLTMGVNYMRDQEISADEQKKQERRERRRHGKKVESVQKPSETTERPTERPKAWPHLSATDLNRISELTEREVAYEYGVTERTAYNWKSRLNGQNVV